MDLNPLLSKLRLPPDYEIEGRDDDGFEPLVSKLRLPPDYEIEGRDDDGFEPPALKAETTTRL